MQKKVFKKKRESQILLKQELKNVFGSEEEVTMATISLLGTLIQKYVANWVLLGYSVLTILLVFSCFQEKRRLKKKAT